MKNSLKEYKKDDEPKAPTLSAGEKKTAQRIFWGPLRKTDRANLENDKVKFLKKVSFFDGLKKHQLEQIAQVIYEREYNENEYIFEMDQPGAALFIVQNGEISVEIPQTSKTKNMHADHNHSLTTIHVANDGENEDLTQLAVLGKYAFFGELALLDESPRSASARAVVPTKVLALFRKDLAQLTETNPDITTKIYKALALIIGGRLKATNDLIEKTIKAA